MKCYLLNLSVVAVVGIFNKNQNPKYPYNWMLIVSLSYLLQSWIKMAKDKTIERRKYWTTDDTWRSFPLKLFVYFVFLFVDCLWKDE